MRTEKFLAFFAKKSKILNLFMWVSIFGMIIFGIYCGDYYATYSENVPQFWRTFLIANLMLAYTMLRLILRYKKEF